MTTKIENLEKDMIVWRTKWEGNNKALLQMAEEVRSFYMTEQWMQNYFSTKAGWGYWRFEK